MATIRLINIFIRLGSTALLVFGIAIPMWGQEHTAEAVAPELAPVHELIDVWDASKVHARRPILIAHRGGVVGSDAPECSKMAVKLAAAHRYDMVELDVRESKDHHPVVFHDQNMMRACGIDGEISDYTLEALTQIHFLNSDETITSLDLMLGLCRKLNLGVMFDIKVVEGNESFFKCVLDLIEKHKLEKACMTLGSVRSQEYLKGKVLLTLPDEMMQKLKEGEMVDLHGYYWFGVPKNWDIELVKPVQDNGGLVIPAINTFRYSEEAHRTQARHDVERLLKAEVDGFQIDCIYQDYFGREKVQEAK
jgi:glycerophosphoryl diester phosphodiesterase